MRFDKATYIQGLFTQQKAPLTRGAPVCVLIDTIIQEELRMVNMAEVCGEHRGLVYHIAKHYMSVCEYDRAIDIEDLAQAGYIGLIQAMQTYDKSKGVFSTWAGVYIKMEIRKVLGLNRRDQRAEHGAASLDEAIPGAADSTLLDTLEAPDDIEGEYDHAELVQGVRGIVASLDKPESVLVQMHDLLGISLSAAGCSCGLTPSAAHQVYAKAMRSLRHNSRLRALAKAHHLDQITEWHRHVSANEYQSTWMSSTEIIAFWRERQQERRA
jgi:RNA polymerase sigma factor (sigma-70 family)